MNIQGPGANHLAISGSNSSRVFVVDLGVQVTMSGLTIEDGNGTTGSFYATPSDGGGILNFGTLMVSGCILSGNNVGGLGGGLGGGIYNAGTLTLSGSTVTSNSARGEEGGGIYNAGTLTLSGSTVTGNSADYGGGIYNTGTATLDQSTRFSREFMRLWTRATRRACSAQRDYAWASAFVFSRFTWSPGSA